MSAFPLSLLGGLLNIGGGILSGGAQNRAVRRAGDDNALNLRGQQAVVGNGVLGSGYGQLPYYQYIYGQGLERNDQNLINQGLSGINNFVNSTGGSVLDQQRGLADAVSQRQTGNLGRFDTDNARLAEIARQNFGSYDQGAQNIVQGAQGAERMAGDWGRGNADIIRRESANDLSSANRQATRGLNARGLGNTTVLNQAQASNQARMAQQRNDALQANNNAMIDRQLGARAQTLGLQQNLHNTRAGLAENQLGREYQRAGDRMGLENQNLQNDIRLRQDPINTLYQTLNGQVMNPYSQLNFGVQPASAAATGISGLGNLFSFLGNRYGG